MENSSIDFPGSEINRIRSQTEDVRTKFEQTFHSNQHLAYRTIIGNLLYLLDMVLDDNPTYSRSEEVKEYRKKLVDAEYGLDKIKTDL